MKYPQVGNWHDRWDYVVTLFRRFVNKRGHTLLHVLARLAKKDFIFWDAFEIILRRYPKIGLLDFSDNEGVTVRQLIEEAVPEFNSLEELLVIGVEEDELSQDETSVNKP